MKAQQWLLLAHAANTTCKDTGERVKRNDQSNPTIEIRIRKLPALAESPNEAAAEDVLHKLR
jgi:hypothetical protein